MADFHILIGNIGTGKSTYAKQLSEEKKARIISCDDFESAGSDNQIFQDIYGAVEKELMSGLDVIFDGKNLNREWRSTFLSMAISRYSYTCIAHNFGIGDENSVKMKARNYPEQTEQFWHELHLSNQRTFEAPSYDEGFSEITEH
jgi:predicted kinase